jgi:hypothetical protein
MSPQLFQTAWLPRVERIFTGADPADGMLRDQSWKAVLLPGGLVLDDDHFSALASVAQRAGDHTVAVTAYAEQGRREPHFELAWSRADFEELATETVLGHVDTVVFGGSESWGLLASPESFAVLGGTPGFMDAFVAAAGGQDSLEDRFRSVAEEGVVGHGAAGEQYVDALLTAVGWRPPQG